MRFSVSRSPRKTSSTPCASPSSESPSGIEPGRLQRPLEVVEHRHHLPRQLRLPANRRGLHLSRHPLAIVLEVRLRPLRQFEVLVPLRLGVGQQRVEILLDLAIGLLRRVAA